MILTWQPAFSHREIGASEIHRSASPHGTSQLLATVPTVSTFLECGSRTGTAETTIQVQDTAAFPESGVIEVAGLSPERPSELIAYAGKTATAFNGCIRGHDGSVPAEHYNQAFVWLHTGDAGFTDQTVTAPQWYKIRTVEWSGLMSEFTEPVLSKRTFADWIVAAGLSGPDAGPAADPDGDGIPNLVEYSLGLLACQADPGGLPWLAREGNELVFRYTRPLWTVGITLQVQTSVDLVAWTNSAVAPVVESATDATQTLAFRFAGSPARQFFRILISQP